MERLELPDGDFLDLAWTPDHGGPCVLVLHGLEGSHRSPYVRAMLAALHSAGYRGVLMHFRGCSGAPNRLPRSYHSGVVQAALMDGSVRGFANTIDPVVWRGLGSRGVR